MSELRTIQAARAIAANLVVFSHLFFVEAKYTASSILPAFTLYGIAGVDLFFVVSGFIMVAVAGRDRGPIEFLWRRATRIYPTYWLVSLTVRATSLIAPTFVNSSITTPISLWRSFLLIPDRTFPLLAVGWTLVYEMYFYLGIRNFLGATNFGFCWSYCMGRAHLCNRRRGSRSGRKFPRFTGNRESADGGIYDGSICRHALEEALRAGSARRRRCRDRRLDSFNSLYSAHAVAGGEPIS